MDFGAIVMLVVLVVVMPVGILVSMTGLAGVLGALVGRNSDLANVSEEGDPNEYLVLANTNPYE